MDEASIMMSVLLHHMQTEPHNNETAAPSAHVGVRQTAQSRSSAGGEISRARWWLVQRPLQLPCKRRACRAAPASGCDPCGTRAKHEAISMPS